jgi:hypothetical protein
MVRITSVNRRGIATVFDVPGSIAAVARSIVAASGGVLEVITRDGEQAKVPATEIVMLQLLAVRRPVLDPDRSQAPRSRR